MLIFDEKTHKVKHWLLEDKEEARAFIDFLVIEMRRHLEEAENSKQCVFLLKGGKGAYAKAIIELWQSQVLRHAEDIESINASIKEVKERLGL